MGPAKKLINRRVEWALLLSLSEKPSLTASAYRSKLCKGMGHNLYGEPAFPNDIVYMFPICILGILSVLGGLSVQEPASITDASDAFETPTEILPDWYLLPSFNLLRLIPNNIGYRLNVGDPPRTYSAC